MATGSVFPNLTVPHFERHGALNNNVSKALSVTLVPLVAHQDRAAWEAYAWENQEWIYEGSDGVQQTKIPPRIHHAAHYVNGDNVTVQESHGIEKWSYAPVWQQSPPPRHDPSIVNFNLLTHPALARAFHGMWETQQAVLSEAVALDFLYGGALVDDTVHFHSVLLEPIYPTFENPKSNDLVGFLAAVVPWDAFFSNILRHETHEIVVVVHNSCGDNFTYQINGPRAIFLGSKDMHERKFSHLGESSPFASFMQRNFSDAHEDCVYDLRIYPSSKMEDEYMTKRPIWFALVVVLIFGCTALVFLLFDFVVALRQSKVMAKAKRTHAIVSSLFPSNVRDRMLNDVDEQVKREMAEVKSIKSFVSTTSRLNDYLGKGHRDGNEDFVNTKPIADLYPSATVMVCTRSFSMMLMALVVLTKSFYIAPLVCGHCRIHGVEFHEGTNSSIHAAGDAVPCV
jgi:CHASE domain